MCLIDQVLERESLGQSERSCKYAYVVEIGVQRLIWADRAVQLRHVAAHAQETIRSRDVQRHLKRLRERRRVVDIKRSARSRQRIDLEMEINETIKHKNPFKHIPSFYAAFISSWLQS